jgi:hypothetical protein
MQSRQLLMLLLRGLGNELSRDSSAGVVIRAVKGLRRCFCAWYKPDGSVCWPRRTIVECLRAAETACEVDGWTSLDSAITFISKENRDQMPSQYGCKTWRQVLRKSGLFELRTHASADAVIGGAWYRSCPDVSACRQ